MDLFTFFQSQGQISWLNYNREVGWDRNKNSENLSLKLAWYCKLIATGVNLSYSHAATSTFWKIYLKLFQFAIVFSRLRLWPLLLLLVLSSPLNIFLTNISIYIVFFLRLSNFVRPENDAIREHQHFFHWLRSCNCLSLPINQSLFQKH